MPPPILADSDDDGDDFVLESDIQVAPGNNVAALDGTNVQSTGSTERLQAEILSARRGLFTASPKKKAPSPNVAHSSDSPALRANKRRQTAGEATTSPEKRVKRTKTVVTYSNKKRNSVPVAQDEDQFAGLREEGQAPYTSQARFTEHSGISSNDLPAGIAGTNFVAHEPNVMFRDTGSTAVDNESSQQRMVELALAGKKNLSTSVAKLVDSDDPNSSSFPWSASGQTPSNKKTALPEESQAATKVLQGDSLDAQPEHESQLQPEQLPSNSTDAQKEKLDDEHGATDTNGRSWDEIFAAVRQDQDASKLVVAPKLRSSPRVEIAAPPAELMSPEPAPASDDIVVHKPTRGRKRKVQVADTDPPNSDEVAVGFPKERYVPRPSRRRATQIAEEPIDYSVVPEKAAKLKRTKTTAVANYTSDASILPRVRTKSDLKNDTGMAPIGSRVDKTASNSSSGPVDDKHSGTPGDRTTDDTAMAMQNVSKTIPSQSEILDIPPVKKQDDDEIFVKPTPKLRSTQRARRSHTTIFEDHVDFSRSQRSPSLSQQQADRKTALKSVENEAVQVVQRKRRKIVDDDEEDELTVKAPSDDGDKASSVAKQPKPEPKVPTKKGGKGRSSKSTTSPAISSEKVLDDSETEGDNNHHASGLEKQGAAEETVAGPQPKPVNNKKTKSAKRVLEDSETEAEVALDEEEDGDVAPKKKRGARVSKPVAGKKAKSSEKVLEDSEAEPEDEHDEEEDEAPKKKGRGRPAKANTRKKSGAEEQATKTLDATGITNKEQTSTDMPDTSKMAAAEISKTGTPTLQAPTPSPDKLPKDLATPHKKVMPTSHSPIKSGSKVPLRVGLSRSQRIPSLLRMSKPPKPLKR